MTAAPFAATAPTAAPDPSAPLLNRSRACEILGSAGLEAFVLTHPLHVYYATNKPPVLDRMTTTHQSLAIVPRDPARPVAYVGTGFEYYYNVADHGVAPDVQVFLYMPGPRDPLGGGRSPLMRVLDAAPLEARELRRRQRTAAARHCDGLPAALAAALADLALRAGTVGIDSLAAQALLQGAAPRLATRPAEDLLRHVRLVKTPAEMALMRAASAANVAAALAAARAAREAGSLVALRRRFFEEAARRGNTPVFMLVDGVMDELYDEPLGPGRGFLIDCVSHYGFYEGDYARTVFIDEPSVAMRRVTRALATAWGEIRAHLRPGLRFSEIRDCGRRILAQHGYDYTVAFKPHAVGLTHEDQPRTALDGGEDFDLPLVEGMVLSVDCPLLDVGVGGTAHLEDLTLITADGGTPIHATGDETIIV